MNTQLSEQVPTAQQGNHADHDYSGFLQRIQERFHANVANGGNPLFTTDAEGLWETYLDTLPQESRQHHTCSACRFFITRFGGLVTIAADGLTTPAIWDETDAPWHYRKAIATLAGRVRNAKVTGVFLSSEPALGTPITGEWRHLAVVQPPWIVFQRTTQSAKQKMAERREDFRTVMAALVTFPLADIQTALKLLRSETLYRSEKLLGQVEWLEQQHLNRDSFPRRFASNLLWRAIALAPAGFCHPRAGMVGTLLEDIIAGLPYETVARRFADKMHPLRYQRPQAAPTLGAIKAAEQVMAQLGAAGSLERRHARLEDITALWTPVPHYDNPPRPGVFGHLQAKGETPRAQMAIPAQLMTWDKFQRTVLPNAERIEVHAPSHGNYGVLVTAVHADAPPILQWDSVESRNPVSWYVWNGGSLASQFGLRGNTFQPLDAITLKPSMWNGGQAHQGEGVLFVIAGAKESRSAGAAIFPETLRSEFHGIRSVIEAYSRSATIEGMREPHVAGLLFDKSNATANVVLRVWSAGTSTDYRLDRWD